MAWRPGGRYVSMCSRSMKRVSLYPAWDTFVLTIHAHTWFWDDNRKPELEIDSKTLQTYYSRGLGLLSRDKLNGSEERCKNCQKMLIFCLKVIQNSRHVPERYEFNYLPALLYTRDFLTLELIHTNDIEPELRDHKIRIMRFRETSPDSGVQTWENFDSGYSNSGRTNFGSFDDHDGHF